MKTSKICPVCQSPYMGRSNQKQCSSSCRHKAFLARANDPTNTAPLIPTLPTVVLQPKPDRQSARPVGKPRPGPTQSPKAPLVLDPQPAVNPQSQPWLDQEERQRERDHESQQLDKQHAHDLKMAQLQLTPITPSPVPSVLSAETGLEGASLSLPLLLTSPPVVPTPAVDEPLADEAGGNWNIPLLLGAGALAAWGYKQLFAKPTQPLAPVRPPQPQPARGSVQASPPTGPLVHPPLGAMPGQKQEAVDASAYTMDLPPIGSLLMRPKKKRSKEAPSPFRAGC